MRKAGCKSKLSTNAKAVKDREEGRLASLSCKSDSTLQLPVDPHQRQRYKPRFQEDLSFFCQSRRL